MYLCNRYTPVWIEKLWCKRGNFILWDLIKVILSNSIHIQTWPEPPPSIYSIPWLMLSFSACSPTADPLPLNFVLVFCNLSLLVKINNTSTHIAKICSQPIYELIKSVADSTTTTKQLPECISWLLYYYFFELLIFFLGWFLSALPNLRGAA